MDFKKIASYGVVLTALAAHAHGSSLRVCNFVPTDASFKVELSGPDSAALVSQPIHFSQCATLDMSGSTVGTIFDVKIGGPDGFMPKYASVEIESLSLNHIGAIIPMQEEQGDSFYGAELKITSQTLSTQDTFVLSLLNGCVGCDLATVGDTISQGSAVQMTLIKGISETYSATCGGNQWEREITTDDVAGRLGAAVCFGMLGSTKWEPRWMEVTDVPSDVSGIPPSGSNSPGSPGSPGTPTDGVQCSIVADGDEYKVLVVEGQNSRMMELGAPGPCENMFRGQSCDGEIPDLYHMKVDSDMVYLTTTCGPQSTHLKNVQWGMGEQVTCEKLMVRVPYGVPAERQVDMFEVRHAKSYNFMMSKSECTALTQ